MKKSIVSIEEKQVLSELFQMIKPNISKNSGRFILELIDANEWGVALESIYDLLGDNEVSVSRNVYNLIQQLASMMEMNTRDWQSLKYH